MFGFGVDLSERNIHECAHTSTFDVTIYEIYDKGYLIGSTKSFNLVNKGSMAGLAHTAGAFLGTNHHDYTQTIIVMVLRDLLICIHFVFIDFLQTSFAPSPHFITLFSSYP